MDRPIHNQTPFGPAEAEADPFALFARWFEEAVEADPNNAAVMTLATVAGNQPSARMVLLKEHSPTGFVFYTHYESRKGHELAKNPQAALTFWFPHAERPSSAKATADRQIRIEGRIEKVSAEASDAYFATRPRDSQLGSWASAQSSVIDEPITLCAAQEKFKEEKIPRPCSWGGLRLVPDRFEFWQGRASRLHDRIVFNQADGGWITQRLAP